jgi:hypothetical protein
VPPALQEGLAAGILKLPALIEAPASGAEAAEILAVDGTVSERLPGVITAAADFAGFLCGGCLRSVAAGEDSAQNDGQ